MNLGMLQIKDLFPFVEGAGYVKAIISAAIEGEKSALKIGEVLKKWNLFLVKWLGVIKCNFFIWM